MAAGTPGALLYVVRPLVFFPVSVLAVAAGFVFGPVLGVILTVVGGDASASVDCVAGGLLGRGVLDPEGSRGPTGKMAYFAERVRDNGFAAVLTVQSVYLPFDLVNYLAGFLLVGWRHFALATLLGSLPGTVSFVLLGSSASMDTGAGTMWGSTPGPSSRRSPCSPAASQP